MTRTLELRYVTRIQDPGAPIYDQDPGAPICDQDPGAPICDKDPGAHM